MIHRSTMRLGFIFTLLYSSYSLAGWQVEDPFQRPVDPSSFTHELKLRMIDYGFHKPQKLNRMLQTAEVIFSQCPQLNLKITVDETLKRPATQTHEDMTIIREIPFHLTQNYYDFFYPFMQSHKPGRIDIHLFDYISKNDRTRAEGRAPFNFGKAYIGHIQDWLFRAIDYSPSHIEPSKLSRNSLFMAMKAVSDEQKNRREMARRAINPLITFRSHDALLAHELGHILLETQKPDMDDIYIDHYCPDYGDSCESEFLMAPGGANDTVQYQRDESGNLNPTLYHSLPKIEPTQCEALLEHPSISRIEHLNK